MNKSVIGVLVVVAVGLLVGGFMFAQNIINGGDDSIQEDDYNQIVPNQQTQNSGNINSSSGAVVSGAVVGDAVLDALVLDAAVDESDDSVAFSSEEIIASP